jgi:amino acid adenylation domain-containing protein
MTSMLLHHLVSEQAEIRPAAPALVTDAGQTSYCELEAASNRIANLLCEMGCKPDDRVCLLLPKSTSTVAALLGTLKAGCIYVPLDQESPAARLAHIVRACEPSVILFSHETVAKLAQLRESCREARAAKYATVEPEHVKASETGFSYFGVDLGGMPANAPDIGRRAGDIAHILFTSGSTGEPKGVQITHGNVLSFVEWARAYFRMSPDDRNSCQPPLHFDLSTFDIFGTFAAGAALHLVPPGLNMFPNKLAEFIRESRLTQWFSVPSLLTYMMKFDVVNHDDFPSLKRLIWCGEVFATPGLIYWMERLPHVSFTNLYGPTEATIASSYYTVPACPEDASAQVPIGRACGGEELLVLDEKLDPAADGETGDLYISGDGLSPGYWQDPEKTASVFLSDPREGNAGNRIYRTGDLATVGDDGLVYFLGRADNQIKSRGYRIELGEIESNVNAIAGVSEAAVVAVDGDGFEGTVICCAYSTLRSKDIPPRVLRRMLGANLPNYMLPSRCLVLDVLPKNANGKIDRRSLRERFRNGLGQAA